VRAAAVGDPARRRPPGRPPRLAGPGAGPAAGRRHVRLDELAAGDQAVHASFQVSLDILRDSPDPVDHAAVAASACSACPTARPRSRRRGGAARPAGGRRPDAAVSGWSTPQLLESLGRPYQFHDLMRLYARQLGATTGTR
jgi:hypothetical protein